MLCLFNRAFSQYNKEQFTPAKLEGVEEKALVTAHGEVEPNRFLDPSTKQTFRYDHLRKVRLHTMLDVCKCLVECLTRKRNAKCALLEL